MADIWVTGRSIARVKRHARIVTQMNVRMDEEAIATRMRTTICSFNALLCFIISRASRKRISLTQYTVV